MKELFFWQTWTRPERRLAVGTLGLLVLSLFFLVRYILDPLGNTIRWDVLSELSDLPAVVDTLPLGSWQFGVRVPTYLITEQFVASTMEIDRLAVCALLGLGLLGLSLALAAASTLPRFWYLGSMVLFILLLAAARLETLGVLGEGSRALFVICTLGYGGVSYYLHAFRPDLSTPPRFGALAGVSVGLVLLVAFTASAPQPLLTAAAYSLPLWLLLTVVFLLMSATEIMAGLVWLSTSRKVGMGRSSLAPFLLISTLYLLSLLLLLLRNTRQIDWDLTLISPVVWGTAAGLLGLWGFRARAESTEGLLPFRSTGFWLYAGLGVIAAAFTGYAAGTANDPLLEVLEDVVVNGQLAMSTVFLFYVVANFLPLFHQGLAVHKVLYKPRSFGLTQTRLFGFVGVVVLFSTQNLLPVYQGVAGYFNGLGDLHTATSQYTLAEQYYKMGLQQEFQNHKSNYALASLALRQGDATAAAYYFRQATLKNPSPQAYVGLSGVLVQENLFFDAVFSLREGLRTFPQSGELLNNLGILYARTNVADSAHYYLTQAEHTTRRDDVPATNLLAIWAKNTEAPLLDSLTRSLSPRKYLSWQANWLAVQNLTQQFHPHTFESNSIRPDSLLSTSGLAYVVNYALNQGQHDARPAQWLPKLGAYNPLLADELLLASLYPEFYSGDKRRALEMLLPLAESEGEKQPLYRKILGHWYLQLGLHEQAIETFSLVNDPEGLLGQAVAQQLAGQESVAAILLERLQQEAPDLAVQALRPAFFASQRPPAPADSLLTQAQASPSPQAYERALRANPFAPRVVAAASDYYLQQKQPDRAYQVVLDALRFNDRSAPLWGLYALMSLEQGLLAQAQEAADQVKERASDADYQAFLNRYQPRRAFIEKQRADFQ
ncbi:hypothetical protein GCM10027275_27870 [Rhabdobacter roseus]|uniref:Putative Zn-dependent protease n=1 Tax=Rhabdobacter roseus TaxID=1655419 RepID=A0A840TP87_9BACT|nr:hypothetical protein [Rhabdobacter roseus]MBB5284735.1 putative Zn-dependent protease [Rhabdobacter roseus]